MSDQPAASTQQALTRLAGLRVTTGFIFGAIVLWLAEPTRQSLAIGATVAGVGEGIRIWAAGHLHKSREVTSSGPYRWCAHPLYVGSSVMGVGLAIASGRVLVALLIAAYLATALTIAVKSEEAFLRRTFGDWYDRYRRGDPGSEAARHEQRRFSAAQARANREHRAVIGLLLAMILLAMKAFR
jgi:protein-S-isoprenylcysteine O-methyltransferase Ste14